MKLFSWASMNVYGSLLSIKYCWMEKKNFGYRKQNEIELKLCWLNKVLWLYVELASKQTNKHHKLYNRLQFPWYCYQSMFNKSIKYVMLIEWEKSSFIVKELIHKLFGRFNIYSWREERKKTERVIECQMRKSSNAQFITFQT